MKFFFSIYIICAFFIFPFFSGLSNEPTPVEVQFLPSGKKVKAYLGQNIGMIAKTAGNR